MGVTSQKCKFDASKNISHKNTMNVNRIYLADASYRRVQLQDLATQTFASL